eukprot:scaffold510879_cov19-Prasinocladus_malaysianus.AAC.1
MEESGTSRPGLLVRVLACERRQLIADNSFCVFQPTFRQWRRRPHTPEQHLKNPGAAEARPYKHSFLSYIYQCI